jgi:cellulose synthase/poly-beta-1,6-N-acetylglucosamine synthase-like glycosyltransferase
VVFWLSALTISYVYAGYPALLTIWARVRARPIATPPGSAAWYPGVSIILAARNEGHRLPARIDNLLALDYPAERSEIVVVSDGSTDDTPDVLARYRDVVRAVAVPAGGKALALNAGVAQATGDILVFADARQMFAPDALRELVGPFVDPAIGGVTGELILDCEASSVAGRRTTGDRRQASGPWPGPERRTTDDRRGRSASTIAEGVDLYWRYEKRLRLLESTVGSTLGATGAIYALRRRLFTPLPADTILDDVLTPMRAVLAGHRVVFNERACAFDRAAVDADAERRRKVRTLAGNVQILVQEPRLLVPGINPVWLQYMSHKVGRLIVPYALLAVLGASLALAAQHVFYALALAMQCGFYALAAYGAWLEFSSRRRTPVPAARTRIDARLARPRSGKGVVSA